MGNIKETVINRVIVEMQQWIETKVLKRLEEAIRSALYGCKVEEESTELSTCMDDNMYILQVFAANKKLEVCTACEEFFRRHRQKLSECHQG